MRKLKAAITGLLLVTATNSGDVSAQGVKQVMDQCIVVLVDRLAGNKQVVSARQIKATCACYVNRMAQGLNNEDCPRYDTVTAQQMREQFSGDW